MNWKHAHILIVSFFLFIASFHVNAQTTYYSRLTGSWNGAVWSTSSSGTATSATITANDSVVIQVGHTITINVTNAVCAAINLAPSTSGTATLNFNIGSVLTVTRKVTLGGTSADNLIGALTMTNGGKLICGGLAVGRPTTSSTFTPGNGTIVFKATNTIPATVFRRFNNLIDSSGTTTLGAGVTIDSLSIHTGATFSDLNYNDTITGSIVNNGLLKFGGVTRFSGTSNQTITGTGDTTQFASITIINTGTSPTNIVEVSSTNFSASPAFLTLTSGILKMSGSYSFNNRFFSAAGYTIASGSGIWLNNPKVVVAAQTGSPTLVGSIRITSGKYYVGTAASNSMNYNTGASFTIDGTDTSSCKFVVAGRFSPTTAASNTITYNQSGGLVFVDSVGSTSTTLAAFDIGASGSNFTMSGGMILINKACSFTSDYYNVAATSTVTGGQLVIGDARTTASQIIGINSIVPIGSLIINGTNNPTARIKTNALTITDSLLINSGGTLNDSIVNISVGKNWINNGTFSTFLKPTVTLSGSNQNIKGSATTTFLNLALAGTGTKTLNIKTNVSDTLTVNDAITLNLSTFSLGSPTSINLKCGAPLGSLITGGDSLKLGGNVTVSKLGTGTKGAVINSPLFLGSGDRKFLVQKGSAIDTSLTISGTINGSFALIKDSLGTLILSGNNTNTGIDSVKGGVLNIQHANALGTTSSGTVVSSGAALEVQGGIAVGAESININGTGVLTSGAIRSINGVNTLGGTITLSGAASVRSDADTLKLTASNSITGNNNLTLLGSGSGLISGTITTSSGTLTKSETGKWILSGTNTFIGATTVSAGVLNIRNAAALGTIAGATTVISGAALEVQGGIAVADTTTISGTGISANGAIRSISGVNSFTAPISLGAASSIQSDADTLKLTASNSIKATNMALSINGLGVGLISGTIATGTGWLVKSDAGKWILSGNNTNTGIDSVKGGVLNIQHANALGTTGSGTVVSSGATLQLQGGITVGAEALNLAGAGVDGNAALDNISGNNTFGGPITLSADATTRNQADSFILSGAIAGGAYQLTLGGASSGGRIGGIISGSGSTASIRKVTSTGIWNLTGTNTYTGSTLIQAGTLRIGAAERIVNSVNVNLGGGTFNTGSAVGYSETLDTVTLSANSTIALGTGVHSLSFANSNTVSWTGGTTLTITGWTGTAGQSGTAGKIYFGTSASGLTLSQLSQISFFDGTTTKKATILSTGEVVPAISPSRIVIQNISSPQVSGVAFPVTINLVDQNGNPSYADRDITIRLDTLNTSDGLSNGDSIGVITNGSYYLTISNVVYTFAEDSILITAKDTSVSSTLISDTSNYFRVKAGTLYSFDIEQSGGGNIQPQVQNVPFNISITATDAYGNMDSTFNSTVTISSTGTLSGTSTTTASFVNGFLTSHTITISNTGKFTITATRNSFIGISDTFNVGVVRYAVSSGNWSGNIWSNSPTGTANLSYKPTSSDAAVILSGKKIIVNASDSCNTLTFNGDVINLTVNANYSLTVAGNLKIFNASNSSYLDSLSGLGTLNCKSITVGGTNNPTTRRRTDSITVVSTIQNLNVSNDITLYGKDAGGGRRNNSIFKLNSGTCKVGGSVFSIGQNNSISTFYLNQGLGNGVLSFTGSTPKFSLSSTNNSGKTFFYLKMNGSSSSIEFSGNNLSQTIPLIFDSVKNRTASVTTSNIVYNNLIVSNKGTKSLSGNTNINKTLEVRSGTVLNLSNYNLQSPTELKMTTGNSDSTNIKGTGTLFLGGSIIITDTSINSSKGAVISCPVDLGATRTISVSDNTNTTNDLAITNVISGTGFGITKTGAGKLLLSANNTYSGINTITTGSLNIQHPNALGANSAATNIQSGACLEIQGGITVSEPITLSGTGVSSTGAIRSIQGKNTLTGLISLIGSSSCFADADTLVLDVASGNSITGNFDLIFGGSGNIKILDPIAIGTSSCSKNGLGSMTFLASNTYTGNTIINAGSLNLGANNTIHNSSSLTLAGGTLNTLAGFSDTINNLLLSDNSFISLGNAAHKLVFALSATQTWTANKTLRISGWEGSSITGGTKGKIYFGNTSSGLTPTQLNNVQFDPQGVKANLLSSGELVPLSYVSLASTTDTLNYGSVCMGTARTQINYTITNAGSATAYGISVLSSNTDYSIVNMPDTIAAGGSRTFGIIFTPSISGTRNSTITISTTSANANSPIQFSVTGIGVALPFSPTGTNGIRCASGTVNLSGIAGVNEVIDWYSSSTDGLSLLAGNNNFTTPSLSVTTTYFIASRNINNGCASSVRSAVIATINPLPNAPTGTNAYRCSSGTMTVAASSAAGETIDWYSAATGDSILAASSNNYTTPSLTTTTTYYAEARNTALSCVSVSRTAVLAVITSPPATPTGVNGSRCATGSVNISASVSTNETADWYLVSTGGTVQASGVLTFSTPSISSTTTYFAAARNQVTGCVSTNRQAVVALVNQSPSQPDVTNASKCSSGSLNLSASPIGSELIDWYADSIGGTSIASNTLTYTTPIISVTTTYYAASRNNSNGCSSSRKPVFATIYTPPSSPIGINAQSCGSSVLDLSSTPNTNEIIDWYDSQTGGNLLAASTSDYSTPNIISLTTTYYIEAKNTVTGCISSARTPVLAIINAAPLLPSSTSNSRCGIGSKIITVTTSLNQTGDWYSASSGGTLLAASTTSYSASISFLGTTTFYFQVRDTVTGCSSATRQFFTLTANQIPSSPSGTDAARCGTGTVGLSASGTGTIKWYNTSTAGSLLSSGNSYTTASISATTTYYAMDSIVATGCVSATRTAVTATVNAVPSAPSSVTNGARCGTGTVGLSATGTGTIKWYNASTAGTLLSSGNSYTTASISSTTTYYAMDSIVATGCTSATRTAVTATVNAVPSAPIGTDGARCGIGTVGLSATGTGTIKWYNASTAGTLLSSGNSYTTASISSTTIYYAMDSIDATGCVSATRTAVTATVNAVPSNVISSRDSARCGSGTNLLTATIPSGATNINWYADSSTNSSILATGSSFTTPSLTITTKYYVASINGLGCYSSLLKAVTATINIIPDLPIGVTSVARCGSGSVTLNATVPSSPTGNNIVWYDVSTGGTPLQTATNYTTPSSNSITTTYYAATKSVSGCFSNRVASIAIINNAPVSPIVYSDSICASRTGGNVSITLSAIGNDNNYLKWYNGINDAVPFDSIVNSVTKTVSVTTTYYVADYSPETGCLSGRVLALAKVLALPSSVTNSTNASRCGTGSVTLGATLSAGAATVNWYADSSVSGIALASGISFNTPSIASTRKYYIAAVSSVGCFSTALKSSTATIFTLPDTPTVSNIQSRCGSGSISLTATSIIGYPIWYRVSVGGSAITTATTSTVNYTTNLSADSIFYVASKTTEGCFSSRVAVTAHINSIPTTPLAVNGSRCGNGTILITATPGANETIDWYTAAVGGTLLSANNLNYTTASLSNTTTYFAAAKNNNTNCISETRTAVIAIVNPTITATVTINSNASGNKLCIGNTVVFTANSNNQGNSPVYQWKLNGVNVGSNTDIFTSSNLSNNDSVWVVLNSSASPCLVNSQVSSNKIINTVYQLPSIRDYNYICGTDSSKKLIGSPAPAISNAWSASNLNIVTLEPSGTDPYGDGICNVLAEGIGSTNITYTDINGCSKTIPFNVYSLPSRPVQIYGPSQLCTYFKPSGFTDTVFYYVNSVNGVSNNGGYVWTASAGARIVSGNGTMRIGVIFDTTISFTTGSILVKTISAYGCTSREKGLRVYYTRPSIYYWSGTGDICKFMDKDTVVTYAVNYQSQASYYDWIIPSGIQVVSSWNIQDSNIIKVKFTRLYDSGDIKVAIVSNCGSTPYKVFKLNRSTRPSAPSAINGPSSVCPYYANDSLLTYYVDTIEGENFYHWELPDSVRLISANNDSSIIRVKILNGYTTASFKVMTYNSCSYSGYISATVSASPNPVPGTISGTTNVCMLYYDSAYYRIKKLIGVPNYIWTVPPGATIVQHPGGLGENDTIIKVKFVPNASLIDNYIEVRSLGCNLSAPRKLQITNGTAPSFQNGSRIYGPTNVCEDIQSNALPNGDTVAYYISKARNASSYEWAVPTNARIVAHPAGLGINDTIIKVIYNSSFRTGTINVFANNHCFSNGDRLNLNISVKSANKPSNISSIQINNCPNRSYYFYVSAMPTYATSLRWSVPFNLRIDSGQGSTRIKVSAISSSSVINGDVSVYSINNCSVSATTTSKLNMAACAQFAATKIASNLLMAETKTKIEFTMFPVPVIDNLNIQINRGESLQAEIRIVDLQGRLIKAFLCNGSQIQLPLSHIRSGVYILEYKKDKQVVVKKFIKL